MASILGVETLQHTNGTTAATIDSSGVMRFPNSLFSYNLFRLNTDITSNTSPLTTWDKPTDQQFADNVTVSSGIFSFSTTGIYLVKFIGMSEAVSNDQIGVQVQKTTDNSSYSVIAVCYQSGDGSSTGDASFTTEAIVDVTDTTNVKVKFDLISVDGGSALYGNSAYNESLVSFMRLGDT